MGGRGAMVVDVRWGREAETVPEEERCRYIHMDGTRCTSRQAAEKDMCQMHEIWWSSIPAAMGMPFPEDPVSLQLFLGQMTHYVMTGRFELRRLRVIEELCRLMAKNLGGMNRGSG
jgi:hypothetical protein